MVQGGISVRGEGRSLRAARFGVLCLVGTFLLAAFVARIPTASGGTWRETDQADFLGGSLTDVTATPAGDLVLAGSGMPSVSGRVMVLDHGAAGAADSRDAALPFVLREASGSYKMWYRAFDGSRTRMMFADSPDGISWTKRGVIINVQTAPYNWDSVGPMCVVKEGTTYHMWFAAGYWSGGPGGFWVQIYYATSADGQAWTVQSVALGLGPAGNWDDGLVTTPHVIQDAGGLYRLYYAGWDATSSYRIGMATSSTHSGFTRYGSAPIIDLGPAGAWDDLSIASPVVQMGTPWTMIYDGSDGTTGRSGMAFSDDGYTWTKSSGNPWFLPGAPGAWDDAGVGGTARVWDPAGERLYYAGYDGSNNRIGYGVLTGGGFASSGMYVSRVFDSGGPGTTWQRIAWNASTPASTTLSLFVRAGNAAVVDGSWTAWAAVSGPSSGTTLSLPRTRYMQYRADLATTNPSVSPALNDIAVAYGLNGAPSASPSSPVGGTWLRTQTPTFQWTVSDPEGDPQAAFEVQLSPDAGFGNYLSSGVRSGASASWQSPALAEGRWYWRVRLADGYGAWGGWSAESFGVDVSAPTTAVSFAGSTGSAGWYTGPVTVSLAANDATSGVSSTKLRVDGGAWQTYAGPIAVSSDGAHLADVYSVDTAGNIEPTHSSAFRIDATPPRTAASLSGRLGQNGWYQGPVTVTLVASDATSGVALTQFRVDTGSWQSYVSGIGVSGDGSHIVEFQSTDRAGNVEGIGSSSFRIDSIASSAVASLAGQLGGGGWYTSAVSVSLSASDATSGVASLRFRVDGGAWQTYAAPFAVSGDGAHAVAFYAVDVAGNVGVTETVAFKIDTTPPVSSSALTGPLGGGGWYTAPVVVTLAAIDASSGVASTMYRIDGGAWQPYAAPFVISGDGPHAVDFRSTDVAGIDELMQSVSLKIDTTPPSTTATPSGPTGTHGWFTGPVSVALAATDAGSGVASTEYRLDGGGWQAYGTGIAVDRDGAHTLEFRSTDDAGLIESTEMISFSIDTVAPQTAVALLGQLQVDHFTSAVVVALAATDATSGVAATEVRIDGGSWQPYTGAFRVTTDGTHTVEFRSTDQAGLQEAAKSVSFRIDTNLLSPSGPVGPWLLVFLIAVIAGFCVLGVLLVRKKRRPEQDAPAKEKKE